MEKYIDKKNHNHDGCFGCSENNPKGLSLKFTQKGEFVESRWNPDDCYQGMSGRLHGGIQALLIDEVAWWTAKTIHGTSGVTARMKIRYRKPADLGQTFIIRGKLKEVIRNLAIIEVKILTEQEMLITEAQVEFFS
ncbi:MAG: hypothetical protein C0594_12320 [Marinilabiliales bacterium]|nr:MAG: hypothetical protein C0594_12320 [Marinilabiliales bacterium]